MIADSKTARKCVNCFRSERWRVLADRSTACILDSLSLGDGYMYRSVHLHLCVGVQPSAFPFMLHLLMHGAGVTKEGDCAWCAAGKYQTGVGLVAEANCTWCVAGKYQSGSGLEATLLLAILCNESAVMLQSKSG